MAVLLPSCCGEEAKVFMRAEPEGKEGGVVVLLWGCCRHCAAATADVFSSPRILVTCPALAPLNPSPRMRPPLGSFGVCAVDDQGTDIQR